MSWIAKVRYMGAAVSWGTVICIFSRLFLPATGPASCPASKQHTDIIRDSAVSARSQQYLTESRAFKTTQGVSAEPN